MEINSEDYRALFKKGKNGALVFRSGKSIIKKSSEAKGVAISKEDANEKKIPVNSQIEISLGDSNRELKTFFIEIRPNTKPRMTRSDKWKNDPNHSDPQKRQRKPVTQYFTYKDALIKECEKLSITTLPASIYTLKFYFRMPDSWSQKKKDRLMGKLHQQTPDLDNITKALFDAMHVQDNYIAEITNGYGKYWSDRDGIYLVV